MSTKDPTDIRPDRKNGNNVSWQVVAVCFGTVIGTVGFAMLAWLCNGMVTVKSDVAVIKHVLHINDTETSKRGLDKSGGARGDSFWGIQGR